MSRIRTLFLIAAALGVLSGCAVADPRLNVETLAPDYVAPPAAAVVRDVAYGARTDQRLDIHLPDRAIYGGPRPVFVWLHAGGWIAGSRTEIPQYVLRQISRAGFAVVSADYALAPSAPFPAAVYDTKTVIRWVKANAGAYGFDPSRIVLGGLSAGGHLAALAGVTAGQLEPPDLPAHLAAFDSKVAAVVDVIGPSDLYAYGASDHPWARQQVSAFLGCSDPGFPVPVQCPPGLQLAASVLPYLDASDPLAYLAYGGVDPVVRADTQGVPLGLAWFAAKGFVHNRVWFDLAEQTGHDLDGRHLHVAALEAFLDLLVRGEIS